MIDIGVINLGKYTLPNIPEFEINVFDVRLVQSEKYAHGTIPDK